MLINDLLLNKCKTTLRIKNTHFDLEVLDLIEAAILDLKTSGLKNIDLEDPLLIQAIKVYCKANFGLENKDSQKYEASYNSMKEKLLLCKEYINVG